MQVQGWAFDSTEGFDTVVDEEDFEKQLVAVDAVVAVVAVVAGGAAAAAAAVVDSHESIVYQFGWDSDSPVVRHNFAEDSS